MELGECLARNRGGGGRSGLGRGRGRPRGPGRPSAVEAEIGAEGNADEPVGGEVAEHGSARVACAAKGAGGYGLEAVEELEGGSGGEEGDGAVDDGFVVGVDVGDEARKDEEDDAHAEHEAGAKEDGGVAGIARGGRIAAADGLAYANGSGGRDAKRNHVGKGDGVESDLMAGERDGAEARDERGDEGEDGDFGGHLQGGGKTKSEETADALEIGISRSFEEIGAMAVVVPEKIGDEEKAEVRARECGSQAGAGDA